MCWQFNVGNRGAGWSLVNLDTPELAVLGNRDAKVSVSHFLLLVDSRNLHLPICVLRTLLLGTSTYGSLLVGVLPVFCVLSGFQHAAQHDAKEIGKGEEEIKEKRGSVSTAFPMLHGKDDHFI